MEKASTLCGMFFPLSVSQSESSLVFTPYIKVRWIQGLNIKLETIKLLEENMMGRDFLTWLL